jgi:hypothetical protein
MKLFVRYLKVAQDKTINGDLSSAQLFIKHYKWIYMADRNNQDPLKDDMTSKGHGRQGIDKAPGEETAQDMQDVVAETQRGKNKVDGDPTQESDQPIEQERD